MFPVFYKTFWLYLLDKQKLQIHHNNNYLLFDVNNHQDFFLFHCILFQTFSNRYYHFQYFCWAAHNLWREKIDLVSDKSSSYNMIINIHSKSKYFTKLIKVIRNNNPVQPIMLIGITERVLGVTIILNLR